MTRQQQEAQRSLYEEFHRHLRHAKRIPQETDFALVNHLGMFAKHIREGQRILDLGCGSAGFSLYAAGRGADVLGVDVSTHAIEENRKAADYLSLPKLHFACEDVAEFTTDERFDCVMLIEVLEHLPDDLRMLRKIHGFLEEDGLLLMSVPSSNAPLHRHYVKRYGHDPFDARVGHLRRYDAPSVFNLLHAAGFELLEFKLCEGLLRNWLFNDRVGQLFMRFNRKFIRHVVTFLDERLFLPAWGESDIIVVARKARR
jgi:SAM-dependent methyltransferase